MGLRWPSSTTLPPIRSIHSATIRSAAGPVILLGAGPSTLLGTGPSTLLGAGCCADAAEDMKRQIAAAETTDRKDIFDSVFESNNCSSSPELSGQPRFPFATFRDKNTRGNMRPRMQLTHSGLGRLALASLATGVHLWIGLGAWLSIFSKGDGVRYLFVSPHPTLFAAGAVGAFALLVTTAKAVGQVNAAWANPLLLFWLSPLAFVVFVPEAGRFLTAGSFALVDLRWWWTALIVCAAIYNIAQGRPPGVNPQGNSSSASFARLRMPLLVIAAICGVWAVAGRPVDQTRRAANSLEAMSGCFLCLSSVDGRIDAEQAMAELLAFDPALGVDTRITSRTYDDWLKMPERVRGWYVEANGREPSNEELGRYLYQWREERVRAEEIRRRIFTAGK